MEVAEWSGGVKPRHFWRGFSASNKRLQSCLLKEIFSINMSALTGFGKFVNPNSVIKKNL